MTVYRTTDTELTSIADAIRAKTGGNSSLVYPTGFVSAINSISTSDGSASSNNLILKDANGDTTSTSAISSDITLGTKNITPTSSAQIITPETGLDGYHTVNVGAMPEYTYLGENMTFVQNLYSQEISLDDTDFSNVTPSSSNTNILASSNLTQIYLPVQYDYFIKTSGYVDYVYTEPINTSAIMNTYAVYYQPIGQRPLYPNDFNDNIYNTISYAAGFGNQYIIFYNNNGVYSLSNNTYGIMLGANSPSTSNASSNTNFGLVAKTPTIRINTNDNYMNSTAYSLLDTTNTKIYMKVDLYKCESRKDIYHGIIEDMRAMHLALHPLT